MAGQNVSIPRRIVRFYQLAVESGVLIVSFETNGETSAAQEAGLLAGDLVVEFDGQPIRGIDDLHKLLTDERIGKRTPVTVIRGVQKLTFDVVPKEQSETKNELATDEHGSVAKSIPKLLAHHQPTHPTIHDADPDAPEFPSQNICTMTGRVH